MAVWLGAGLAVRVGATVGLVRVVRLERVVGVTAVLVAAGVVLVARGVSSVVTPVAAIRVGLVLVALVRAVLVPEPPGEYPASPPYGALLSR